MKKQELRQLIKEIIEAEIDTGGNLVGFKGGDWKSQVEPFDHIHFFIEPQMADELEDKLRQKNEIISELMEELLKGKKCVNKHIIIARYIQLEILFLLLSPNK